VARAERNAVSADDQRPAAPIAGEATLDEASLDDLFRRAAARRPHALALIDPPNRASFTGGRARRLTYGEADRIVSALAARLRALNHRGGAVIALQIANTVESVLAFLAVLRAGLVAMPLPLLWRQAEAVAALRTANAGALIVSGRIGDTDHFDLAVRLGAEVFSVRQVCGFGGSAPDGAVSLDDLLTGVERPSAMDSRRAAAAEGSAAITFDISTRGLMAVSRSDAELINGGLAVLLESAIPQDAVILSTIVAGSFAALATTLVPWLLAGGTLALHQPFDGAVLAAQLLETDCAVAVVPGPLLAALAQAGRLSPGGQLQRVIALWRSPEQLPRAPHWEGTPALIDVQVFGETGLVAGRRGPTGMPAPIPLGQVVAPRGDKDARKVIEVERTAAATLALRGPMLAHAGRPAGEADRFIDTGFPCRIGADGVSIEIAGPPPGVIGCGGYRFVMHELSALVRRVDPDGILIALPDALAGHRLAGFAANRNAIRAALQDIGANPLLVAAFRDQMSDARGQEPSDI
jgi:non-ribosomal peptide synthetase component F